MACCTEMDRALDLELVAETERHLIHDGRVVNDIDSTFFHRSTDVTGRASYLALNYCPFCGRALSRGLWQAEKKK